MTRPIQVVLIGQESPRLEALSRNGEFDRSIEVTRVDPPDATSSLPESADVDAILVDATGEADVSIVERIREHSPDLPILVVVDGSDVTGEEALEAGASDVLRPADLAGEGAVCLHRLTRFVEDAPTELSSTESSPTPYRTLVESAGDPMYVLDDSGRCTIANEAMAHYAGYDREQLIGMHAAEIIGSEDFERASDRLRSLIEAGEDWGRIEFTFESANGESRVCEATLFVLYENGTVIGSAGVVRDVSDREARERELAQFETIVETAPIGLFVLDEEGTISWANEEFVQGFAEPEPTLVGSPFPELVERGYFGPESITEYVENVRTLLSSEADEDVINHEVRFNGPGGEVHRYEASVALLPLEDGEFCGTVHAFRNVTAQRAYERELERQNERLERFASLVSHDLRNPLNVAQGHVGVLGAAVEHESIPEIAWALDRMAELIDDLLELARQGQTVGDPEPVDLDALAEQAWDVVETGSAAVIVDIESRINADPGRLHELFTNLFRNAIEHGGDSITVRVGRLNDGGEGASGPFAGFFVEDDGVGLPGDDIFEIGYSTADDGTGFGLAIVAEIAEAHDWSVTAGESKTGGARFEIRGVTRAAEAGDS